MKVCRSLVQFALSSGLLKLNAFLVFFYMNYHNLLSTVNACASLTHRFMRLLLFWFETSSMFHTKFDVLDSAHIPCQACRFWSQIFPPAQCYCLQFWIFQTRTVPSRSADSLLPWLCLSLRSTEQVASRTTSSPLLLTSFS